MLLADRINASTVQLFNLLAIRRFQETKNPDIARLQLMRNVRRKSTENNIMFITKGHYLERFMRAKAITNQNPRFVICSNSGLRVKYISNPVKIDGSVSISGLGAGKVLSRSRVSRSRVSMGVNWPDDERMERLTVCRDTIDCLDQSPLDTRPSTVQVVPAG
jgi:hypothetical protein